MRNTEKHTQKNVLMVAYVFPPIAYAGSFRTLRFCQYLPANGWIPKVLTIEVGVDLKNDFSLLDRLPEGISVNRTKTIDFWRFWIYRKRQAETTSPVIVTNKTESVNANYSKKGILYLLKNWFWEIITTPDHMLFWVPFAFIKAIRIWKAEGFNVIYTSSPPHSEQYIGFLLKKITRKPWVADFRDPVLDSSGYAPQTFYRANIDKRLEKMVVKNADKILIISDNYKKLISQRYPEYAEKFITIINGYDPSIFENIDAEVFDKFTIIYAGSFYAQRKPDLFLKGLSECIKQQKIPAERVQVLLYTYPTHNLSRQIHEHNLHDVVQVFDFIPQDELLPKLKGSHLQLLIIGFDDASKGTVTSKIFEYMACNRPIFAIMPVGDASYILKEYDQLYHVSKDSVDDVAVQLETAYNDYIINEKNSTIQENDNHFLKQFNVKYHTEKLVGIFEQLIKLKG